MSATTTKFVGRFTYQADVVPKGSRNPRRIDMWAPAQYEIATVAEADLAKDAILVQPRNDDAGHAGAIPLALAAYDGALWSPMAPIEHNGAVNNFAHLPSLGVEDYLAQATGDFQQAWSCDDPILAAYDRSAALIGRYLPPVETMRENDFLGRTVWSNRTESLAAHLDAARDVLFAGDRVYVRRPEPTWAVEPPRDGCIRLVLTGLLCGNQRQRFRLDRLDDALAWMRQRYPNVRMETAGRTMQADHSLLRRNDLACMVRDLAPATLHGQSTMALAYLPDEAVTAWRSLSSAALSAPRRTFLDDRIDLPLPRLAADIAAFTDAMASPSVPSLCREPVQRALEHLLPLRHRAAFELTRDAAIEPADDAALAGLGA